MRRLLRSPLLASLLFGLAVSVAITLYGDAREVWQALKDFDPWAGAGALLLGAAAFALRGARWHWFLCRVGEPVLPVRASAEVYAAGVAMQLTPGRVGEWVKSYYVQALGGAPPARTAPIVLAERITDMLGLVALAAAGMLVYRTAFWVVGISAVLALVLLFTLTHRPTATFVSKIIERVPVANRLVPHADDFYGAAGDLLTTRTVPIATSIAFLSWVCEAVAYWLVLWGLGIDPSWRLLFQAAFIWPVASLAGGLLLTPGGLGVAEGGLAALANTLVDGLTRGPAAAAALLARFATLWVGVVLGLAGVGLLARRGELIGGATDEETVDARTPAITGD